MGYLKSIGTAIIYVGLILAVITFMPGLPPETEFVEYSITPPRQLDPKVGPKNRLNGIQKLFNGEIHAPESFDSYNGQLYTGIHGGYVLRIEEDRIVPIVKFGEKCDGIWQEHKCGRPLGLKFDKKGNLYVVDAYYGIFQVNVATGEYKNIVNITKPIDGKVPRIPNSIDIAKNGDIYWTDSNTDFALYDLLMTFLTNPSGRLIRYNAAKKENEVLMRNIAFANGVVLSDDESFVLAVETLKNRIMKYNLKGPKAGQQEIFIDGLPGIPDNIHSDGHGGFLLSLIIADDPDYPQIFQSLMPHPYLRKMLVRLIMTMELPFKLLNDVYSNPCTERILHAIGSYQGAEFLSNPKEKSSVLRIDASGNIIEILTADDGSARRISSAYIHNGFLWLGSPFQNYLGRVPLIQAFPDLADSAKQSSHTRSEKQSPNVAASNVKTERAKRDADSTTVKPIELNRASQTTPKPTAAPTTTTPKPKTTATPKPSPVPKTDKPMATASNVKPPETKSSTNAEAKKDNAKTVDAKLNSPKSEKSSKKEDTAKTQPEKKIKVEQNASVKQTEQKSQSEKVKRETNHLKDDL
ncbi:PREDICTED: adipocyte plasma membrane-associated protein-like [Trachymyrmex cornetzi]|uniref:Adipocyte plasma membrane-associated protein n=1 Tax=Trachymyrmex cornetzi TaxID=471704 RepID=A0A195EMV0_9HYME|nr:PREDICTED: adipocyte plasma membrane-associated protein-like [Trachymyrmex cornetzi]KYN29227.1 Adipocyte plasma membrane-associated protein [Trachymyrmex cornetzi]